MRVALFLLAALVASLSGAQSAQDYDLLLKGGHVIDSRNNLSAVRDVAIIHDSAKHERGGAPYFVSAQNPL
jgi:hypothetical protein